MSVLLSALVKHGDADAQGRVVSPQSAFNFFKMSEKLLPRRFFYPGKCLLLRNFAVSHRKGSSSRLQGDAIAFRSPAAAYHKRLYFFGRHTVNVLKRSLISLISAIGIPVQQ